MMSEGVKRWWFYNEVIKEWRWGGGRAGHHFSIKKTVFPVIHFEIELIGFSSFYYNFKAQQNEWHRRKAIEVKFYVKEIILNENFLKTDTMNFFNNCILKLEFFWRDAIKYGVFPVLIYYVNRNNCWFISNN